MTANEDVIFETIGYGPSETIRLGKEPYARSIT
jgi:hypothetical protein